MYTNQLGVKWNEVSSQSVQPLNGIKQGGVIYPSLFCLYINNLLEKLKEKGYGCFIGPHYYGGFGYADDIVLLCPSVSGMNKMLNIHCMFLLC